MIDLRPASVPGEKRKEVSAESPRAVSLWVREARGAARAPGGVNVWLKAHLSVPGLSALPSPCLLDASCSGSCAFPNLAVPRSGQGHW